MTTMSAIAAVSLPFVQLQKATDGISPKEAAARLGVTVATIHNWISRGALPATRFGPPGGRAIVRIDPDDLEAMRGPA